MCVGIKIKIEILGEIDSLTVGLGPICREGRFCGGVQCVYIDIEGGVYTKKTINFAWFAVDDTTCWKVFFVLHHAGKFSVGLCSKYNR